MLLFIVTIQSLVPKLNWKLHLKKLKLEVLVNQFHQIQSQTSRILQLFLMLEILIWHMFLILCDLWKNQVLAWTHLSH